MKGNSIGRPRSGLSASGTLALGIGFAVLMLGPTAAGVCGCTTFTISAASLVLMCAVLVGNSTLGALTSEREKKTLDCLRLTQLTAHQVLFSKLRPELSTLSRILLAMGPTVLLTSAFSDAGLTRGFLAVAIAAMAGVLSSVYGLFLSSMFDSTSRAVVAGWVSKAVWLLLTPVLDTIGAAIVVSKNPLPLFDQFNPLAAVWVLAVPEATTGVRAALPVLFLAVAGVSCLAMWMTAVRRFDSGMVSAASLTDRRVHTLYRKGWGPAWLQARFPGLKNNPSFLRELTLQLRSGAGRWPGYAVFVVLFLAPFLYAQSWAVKDSVSDELTRPERPVVTVVGPSTAMQVTPALGEPGVPSTQQSVHLSVGGTRLVLHGHTGVMCMRLTLNHLAGVPLPPHSLARITETSPLASYSHGGQDGPGPTTVPMTQDEQVRLGLQRPTDTTGEPSSELGQIHESRVRQSSLALGVSGAVVLLLLYLAIRCSGFLATAVTSEKDRRSWEDLALTGISPEKALSGKLMGALMMPLVQMTAAFPVLLFFSWSGTLGLFEVLGLYVYAVVLAVTAGLLGLWSSANSPTSHEAHARALMMVLIGFTALPILVASAGGGLAFFGLLAALVMMSVNAGRPGTCLAWTGLTLAMWLTPKAMSPLTSALGFMPTLSTNRVAFLQMLNVAPANGPEMLLNWMGGLIFLGSLSYLLWTATLRKLAHPSQEVALHAELAS